MPAAPSAGIMLAIVLEKNAAEDVDKAFEDACKQEVVVAGEGGNTSVACTVMTIAADIAETAAESEELIDTESTDWLVTGIYLRENDLNNNLGQVDGDVLSVQASAGNTQASVTQLQAQVAALQVSVTALKTQLANAESVLSQKLNVNNAMNKQIMQLLLVPSGSRSVPASLLSCTGDSSAGSPCPTVALSCSAATGQCTFSSH